MDVHPRRQNSSSKRPQFLPRGQIRPEARRHCGRLDASRQPKDQRDQRRSNPVFVCAPVRFAPHAYTGGGKEYLGPHAVFPRMSTAFPCVLKRRTTAGPLLLGVHRGMSVTPRLVVACTAAVMLAAPIAGRPAAGQDRPRGARGRDGVERPAGSPPPSPAWSRPPIRMAVEAGLRDPARGRQRRRCRHRRAAGAQPGRAAVLGARRRRVRPALGCGQDGSSRATTGGRRRRPRPRPTGSWSRVSRASSTRPCSAA